MTESTLGSLFVLAATAAASPFSLIAFSLVLATDRGTRNGFAFILGWITTVMLIGTAMIVIGASTNPTSSNPAGKWMLALELALGVALLILWIRRRFAPRKEVPQPVVEKPEPAWQRKLATMGFPGAFVVGGLVQTWPVMIAAGAELARLDASHGVELAWMFVFAVATTAGIVVLEILAIRSPGSAADRLDRIRNTVDNHRSSVINWAFLVGGLWLFFRGLIGLVSQQ